MGINPIIVKEGEIDATLHSRLSAFDNLALQFKSETFPLERNLDTK